MNNNPIKQASNVIFITGIMGLVFGILHLVSYFSNGSITSLYDAGFNALFGILLIVTGRLLSRSRKLSVLFLGLALIGSLGYGFLVGRGLNYFYLFIGGVLLAWTLYLWWHGDFS